MDDLQKLVQGEENPFVEFKMEVTDDVVHKLSTAIAAFANCEGGRIIFGVSNEKELLGCSYDDKTLQRISQEASKCRPAAFVAFEHIPIGSKRILIVQVPKSPVLHKDNRERFPTRIGNQTDYLDLTSILMLARERRLLSKEVQGIWDARHESKGEQDRMPLSDAETSMVVDALSSKNATLRYEALQDLTRMSMRDALFEQEEIVKSLQHILNSGKDEEIGLVLDIVRSASLNGSSAEKEAISQWMEKIREIGESVGTAQVARRAFDVLQLVGHLGAVDLLVHWVTETDDNRYSELQPENQLTNIRFSGLENKIRSRMYILLKSVPDKVIADRIRGILDAVRKAY